jgi:hypothetical protein
LTIEDERDYTVRDRSSWMLRSFMREWRGAVIRRVAGVFVGGVLLIGCGPGECKEAKPLLAEMRAAIGKQDLTGTAATAEKLSAVLDGSASPELSILERHTDGLRAAIEKAQVAPTDASGLAARDLAAVNLGSAITVWQDGAALVDAKICK